MQQEAFSLKSRQREKARFRLSSRRDGSFDSEMALFVSPLTFQFQASLAQISKRAVEKERERQREKKRKTNSEKENTERPKERKE